MNRQIRSFPIDRHLFLMVAVLLLAMTPSSWAKGKPSKYEKYLANSAACLGTDMLVKDRSDATGMTLVSAALRLDPDNERALLTSMLIKKDLELTIATHKYTADDFIKKSTWRGKQLFDKKSDEYSGTLQLAMVYFSLAELLKKDDETVLIYLEKLHREEDVSDLVDILESNQDVTDWLAKKTADGAVETKEPVTEKPVKTDPFWGVNQPVAELTKLYGKATRTKYAPRSNGTLKYFTTPTGQVEAFISGGKCVRVQFSLPRREYPTAADRDAYVTKDRPGWKVVLEKGAVRGYENADRTMAASITEAGTMLTFVAWSKRFYK